MFDAAERMPQIPLGALTLPAESFSLQAENAEQAFSLCDGTQKIALLGEKPVCLRFSGRISAADAGALPLRLLQALREHTPFSFAFCGCTCTDMVLAGVQCEVREGGRTARYALKMYGKITEVPQHDNEADSDGTA